MKSNIQVGFGDFPFSDLKDFTVAINANHFGFRVRLFDKESESSCATPHVQHPVAFLGLALLHQTGFERGFAQGIKQQKIVQGG